MARFLPNAKISEIHGQAAPVKGRLIVPMFHPAAALHRPSLKPQVDRLIKCVEFLISNDGRVLSTNFYAAVIHSQRRFTYQEALAILERKPAPDPIEHMLHEVHELAQRMRRLRFRNGSLDLDFPESKIRLDERGRILRIEKTVNDVSHQLIEECMLLANEAVATRLMQLGRPAVYRVHEQPDERRLQEYREDLLSRWRARSWNAGQRGKIRQCGARQGLPRQ